MDHKTLLEDVIVGLYKIGAVKFGEFKLRSGVSSPVYIDLRSIVAYPELLKNISELVWLKVQSEILPKVDPTHRAYVCGVPYSALTIATSLCVNHSLPSLIVRKEAKVHGTKKLVEGILEDGKKNFVIVVEDVVTSGISISETVDKIKDASTSVVVTEAIAFLDRQQGGMANLNKVGVNSHSIVTLHLLAEVLEAKKHISGEMKDKIFAYVRDNQISLEPATKPKKKELSFQERKKLCKSEFSRVVLDLMTEKKSNLVLAADVNSTKEVLHLADLLGPEICMLKTHVDMLDDFDAEFVKQLSELARKHRFLIFEDRKFADIGKTVKQQYTGGVYKIANWSHLVNCHLISGKTIVKALKEGAHEAATLHNTVTRGLLLIAQMSSVDANTNNSTAEAAYAAAIENEEFVSGFICQEKFPELLNLPDHDKADAFLYFTPGVHLQQDKTDNLGQHYNSPEYVMIEKKTDAIIVGTGICGQPTDEAKLATAKLYRKLAWDAYEKKIHQ